MKRISIFILAGLSIMLLLPGTLEFAGAEDGYISEDNLDLSANPIEILSGDYNYFLKVDLDDPRVRIRVGLANNDNGGYETLSSMKNRYSGQGYSEWAIINGDLFGSGCPSNVNCAQGLTYIDSNRKENWSAYGNTWMVRGDLGLDSTLYPGVSVGDSQTKRHMVIGGGPRIVINGGPPVCNAVYESQPGGHCGVGKTYFPHSNECFDGDVRSWCTDTRSITLVGFSADRRYLFMGISEPSSTYNVVQLAQWLKDRGAYEVLRFDSGSSSGMYHNSTGKGTVGKLIVNHLSVIVDNEPPEGIELCDGTNYGSPCQKYTHTINETCINLADSGFDNRAESLRFLGSYVGNYEIILHNDNGCSTYIARYGENSLDLGSHKNETSSIRIEKHGDPSPDPPSNVQASDGTHTDRIQITWNSSANATSYEVHRANSPGGIKAVIGTSTGISFDDVYVYDGATYYYWVKACNENGCSDFNAYDTGFRAAACPTINHWKGEYWNNMDLSGAPALCRDDFALDFNWGNGSPDSSINNENFSARWTRDFSIPPGQYRFHLTHDDGARLYINGILEIDAWDICCVEDTIDLRIYEGTTTIKLEMYENGGAANVDLWWERLDITGWCGEYYNNTTLSDHPILIRNDGEDINFHWYIDSPDPLVNNDNFSVRWTRTKYFSSDEYEFDIYHDDGAHVYIGGDKVYDNWCDNCVVDTTFTSHISSGFHVVKMELFENGGWSSAELNWKPVNIPGRFSKINPINGLSGLLTTLNLSWEPAANAESYEYCILQQILPPYNCSEESWINVGDDTGVMVTDLIPHKRYHWQVRARNSSGFSCANDNILWVFYTTNPLKTYIPLVFH